MEHVLIVHGLVSFGSLFAAFYILQYVLKILMQKRYAITPTKEQSAIVIGYGLVLVFLLFIATAILPSFFFLWIFYLYTAFLLWVAAEVVFNLKVEDRGVFVIGMAPFSVSEMPISERFNSLLRSKMSERSGREG